MSLLTSSVVHQVAIAPTGKSAAKEPNSTASAAAAAAVPKTRSAALRAVVPDE
jgi:hypothetical protein